MTLTSHANAALRDGHPLRLPPHPAFTVVRLTVLHDGAISADLPAWFGRVRDGSGPVVLADAGLDGDALLATGAGGWRVGERGGGLVIEPATAPSPQPLAVAAATADLRRATALAREAAGPVVPATWADTLEGAMDILDSTGTGEELSDVAWPHFLLAATAGLPARRLAAAAATLWWWDAPGAWTGGGAAAALAHLRTPVAEALLAAVAEHPG